MVEFKEVEDYYENGMEESLELEYELTQPKIEDEVIEHEMNENELVAWKIMLNFLSITKEPELINESDRRGKEFLSMGQAEEFYTLYSKVIGFSVRKKKQKGATRKVMLTLEVGCVQMKVSETQNDSAIEQTLTMKRAGMKTAHIWQYMVEVHGGWHNIGFIKDDLYHGLRKKYSTWDDCDTKTVMKYLKAKEGPHPGFWYKYEADMEGRLTNLFWADSSCKVDYQLFGDCLAFDSTYKTNRTMWADTFLRGHYFGDARATGRCESMNAFLKRDLVMDLALWMFLRHCDISLAMLRYNEMREHYKTTMTDPVLNQTNMESVEDEVASIFTREIFTRIRDEIKRSDKYVFEKAGTRTNYTICSVAKYRHESRKRTVLYSDDGEDVRCDCYWFETNGIPCQHIFTCMKSLHKHSFQSCLINHRWLKDAKEILPANLGLERKCPHPQMIENSRYGGVTTQTSLVAFYATRSKASFELTMEVLSELLVKLEKIPRDEDYSQNNADDDEFGDKILDSRVLPTKENESDEDFRALLLNHGVEDAVCYDNVLFIPREKLMNSDNTDAKEIINQMLGDTHLHTYVYVVTDKIIDYALRMWTGDFCCNLCVTVDISVLVYVHPEHNSDTEDDHVSENGSIDFVAASEASINKFEKCLNENELLCNICFENVHNDVEVRKLPCKHSYHGECIVKWLKTSKYCPLL
ncbi:hypothetical protein F8388_004703 [Cannabis sativa]|uniref:Protein FAR1-RELATED SEQUENCE n=1 Tax=Cannabis sativa TaxID=3483 RepID=A0A7J6HNY9_CANSA|nr:hypothetical protein F8388_004703 [Cannabis sativa]